MSVHVCQRKRGHPVFVSSIRVCASGKQKFGGVQPPVQGGNMNRSGEISPAAGVDVDSGRYKGSHNRAVAGLRGCMKRRPSIALNRPNVVGKCEHPPRDCEIAEHGGDVQEMSIGLPLRSLSPVKQQVRSRKLVLSCCNIYRRVERSNRPVIQVVVL